MDSSQLGLRVGQLNLQGSALATAELPAIAGGIGLDVVLVQEPYSMLRPSVTAGGGLELIASGTNPKSGLFFLNKNLSCVLLHQLSGSHCTVCHIQDFNIYLISAYFQYSDDIALHLNHLNMVLDFLRGRRVLVGVDSNAHSPMWHCAPRNYVGRGHDVTYRRQQMEDFIVGRGLNVVNTPGEPFTFSTDNGESNIDITLATGGVPVLGWTVHADTSCSDHRLITYEIRATRRPTETTADPSGEPMRFRERGVNWERFRSVIHARVGLLDWSRGARGVCRDFGRLICRAAEECLGKVRGPKRTKGYEWWTPALDDARRAHNRLRRTWQSAKRGPPSITREEARAAFACSRNRYRRMMEKARLDFFHDLANTGNDDPWGLAYRVASGRLRPPPNIINGVKFAEEHAADVESAMHNMVYTLCPDDQLSEDSDYHRQVRLLAACAPSGRDAPPPSRRDLWGIVRDLPNTAPGIDGVTARMVKHVWLAADSELTRMFGLCVEEGTFPDTWKDGRLVVLPKGNGKPLCDPKAYRPITLLSVLGKILERVILLCAPTITRHLSPCQHGFTRGRSTLSALKTVQEVVAVSQAKYVQAIYLDISGAFDNAWWPMILLKAKTGGCPPNIYRMLVDYFNNRRVGYFVGSSVLWKTSTMGCPQGSVLGPSLWNLLMDDLFRLPYPDGVQLVAYADDVTVLIESNSRAGIERTSTIVTDLMCEWGKRNRLGFSPSKSLSMTLKGKMPGRPPTIRLNGTSVRSVQSTRVLGVVIDSGLNFREHAQTAGERAAAAFGKMTRVSASSWGVRYHALKTLYRGTYAAIITYAAGCWWGRASSYMVRSALLRTQRPALILLTKAYRSCSTAALPVLAGVLPADLEVCRAGRLDDIRHLHRDEFRAEKLKISKETVASWQQRWESEDKGRELHRFFPDVEVRLKSTWVEPDYEVSQILTGHGCFRRRLWEMKLVGDPTCYCTQEDETLDHALWRCPLYDELRTEMLRGIVRAEEGPVHYLDLVSSEANFRRLRTFARGWHKIRSRLEQQERRTLVDDEAVSVTSAALAATSRSTITAAPERGEGQGH